MCIGEQVDGETALKSFINLAFFRAHREEVLALKEQVKLIKEMLNAS